MTRWAKTSVCALFIGSTRLAQAATITPEQAATQVGQSVTAEGVAHVHVTRNEGFIDMGPQFPSQVLLGGGVGSKRLAVFGDLMRYDGKVVEVEGMVRMFRGKPEIILEDPSQLSAK